MCVTKLRKQYKKLCVVCKNMCVHNLSTPPHHETDVGVGRDDEEARPHLEVAFGAFCKRNRDEELSLQEIAALDYCDRESVYYILPAIFRTRKPYPSFNCYDFCPPDVLHTIIGGYLKDFVFNVCVVVNELRTLQRGRYKNNLTLLDEMLKHFPVQQAAGYKLKRYDTGVTPYVVNLKGGTKSTTTSHTHFLVVHTHLVYSNTQFFVHTYFYCFHSVFCHYYTLIVRPNFCRYPGFGTSGMGGLSDQDVPDLVLQILFCLGNEGKIIPVHLVMPASTQPVVVIALRCGYRALNYFYNLRRTSLTHPQIAQLTHEVRSLHYDYLLLYRVKQQLLKNMIDYGGKNCV